MKFLFKVFRIKEWAGSKLVMQTGIFLMLAFCCGIEAAAIWKPFLLFAAYSATYFALGYIANDLSDIKSDRQAGKRNAFQEKGAPCGIALFVLLSVLNIGVALIISLNRIYILIIGFGYLLGIFYSFKPLRFKERGVLGLIVASLCQRNLQLAVIPFLFEVDYILFALVNALIFINGIRYILIHQYLDSGNDIKSGTETFAVNRLALTKKIIMICYAAELVLMMSCFAYAFGLDGYYLLFIPVALFAVELSLYVMIVKSRQSLFTSYGYVPLDLFYLLGIPVTFLSLIAASSSGGRWACLIVCIFLIVPAYSMLKIYFGYAKFFAGNSRFIHGCRKLWKSTQTVGGLYFINVTPVFGEGEEAAAEKLNSYAVLCPCKARVPFSALTPYLQGDKCVELIFNPELNSFEQPLNNLQLKNKSILHYFAVYVIPKEIFWMNRKKSAAQTIVNCMAHCGENRQSGTIGCVECAAVKPDKNFYRFYGLACSELYFRRKDCFMSVFPSFLMFTVFWLAAGVAGLFVLKPLAVFSGACLAAFCLAAVIDGLFTNKTGLYNSFVFYKNLYLCRYSGRRVPPCKKYGVYTDKIVAQANRRRNMAAYAILAMAIALIVVCCLAAGGVI